MKKLIYALTVLMALATIPSLHAQLRYGLRLGGEFTHPTGSSSVAKLGGGSGFAGGLTLEWQNPTNGVALDASLEYQRRTLNLLSTPKIADKQDCLVLPLSFKYKFWMASVSNLAAPYLFTGPDLALQLNNSDVTKRFNFGWNVGAGFDVVNFIQISGGYRFGINDIARGAATIREGGGFVRVALLFDF